MFPDRLYIQHTTLEGMLEELAELSTIQRDVVVRVEAFDREEVVGLTQASERVSDHVIGVEVTAADPRGDIHVLFLGDTAPLRVVHRSGERSKDRYEETFADARELRSRLVAWLDDEGWLVRSGRVFVPRKIVTEGYSGSWESDPMHQVEQIIEENGGSSVH